MFPTAKPFSTFSTSRWVRNHYSKRILNLILNRKKFFGQKNEALDKQKTAANAAVLEMWRVALLLFKVF